MVDQKIITAILDGVEIPADSAPAHAVRYQPEAIPENPTSYPNRGLDRYRTALYVGPNGIDPRYSVPDAVTGGSFDNSTADAITIKSTSDDFTGIMSVGGTYSISNAKFSFDTKSDGSSVSDFNGYGSIIDAMQGSQVTITDTVIESHGVAKPAIYCDEKSDVLVKDSTFRVMGGTIYKGYRNSASSYMVAPPWVLGITGSARAINIMGNRASVTLVNSSVTANQWGVLSTDVGQHLQLDVIDTDLLLAGEHLNPDSQRDPFSNRYGSGYGSYIIGNAQEHFYGVHMKVGTYGAILNSGDAYYESSDQDITVTSPSRSTVIYSGHGKGRNTIIDSDAFGFMAHGGGSLNILNGTKVTSAYSTFLLKAAGVDINLQNSNIISKNGVLLEMIDDDDPLVGANMIDGRIVFKHDFHEVPGWPSENGQLSSELPPRPMGPGGIDPAELPEGRGMPPEGAEDILRTGTENTLNAREISLCGDIYNGTGYYGMKAYTLTVNLDEGSVLSGTISATESRHIDETGQQNTHFTIHEFYYMGHMEHRSYFNGENKVAVNLHAGSVWNVTKAGIITSLTVAAGALFHGRATIDGIEITPICGKTYEGIIHISPA